MTLLCDTGLEKWQHYEFLWRDKLTLVHTHSCTNPEPIDEIKTLLSTEITALALQTQESV